MRIQEVVHDQIWFRGRASAREEASTRVRELAIRVLTFFENSAIS
jgi:hypothetical protein